MISKINEVFPNIYAPDVSTYYTKCIDKWKNIFENNPPWQKVKKTGLYAKGERIMKKLNVGKVLCDTFSDLTFSEQVNITIDDGNKQKYVENCLNKNGFWKQTSELLSNAYAIGGCCFKVYAKKSKPTIDYVHADKFAPVEWTGKEITGGVFVSTTVRNKFYYNLFEYQSEGKVEYKLFKSANKSELGIKCESLSELYADIADNIDYNNTDTPMFAYFKPCVSNNYEYDTPLGMSIYANAIDTLEALDIAFDSFVREFILGKKRIIVPSQAIKTVVDPATGNTERYFDADDEAFVALKTEDNDTLKITDNTVILRVEEHVAAINAFLNILCFQAGLSAGSLSFDAVQGMKTATEVVSQDSKTARTIKCNKNLLTETLESVVHSIIAIGVWLGDLPKTDYAVTIGWQDNIVVDDNTLIDNNIKLFGASPKPLKSQLKAIMEVQKCDEKTAQEEIDRINKEQSVTGLAVDDLMGSGETGGDVGTEPSIDTTEVVEDAEDMAGKTLNGAQTASLISIISQYQSGTLSIGQAINIVSVSIGVSKEEAKKIIEGAE